MRKEAVNSFSGGLNYDLNPITTPNNVLTEAINCSFITFNGDELALQNDAGNTKILISGTSDYVQLSEGFYPIGIKEYGGVLYIVSGYSKINSALLWNSTTTYPYGSVVIYNEIYYYQYSEGDTNATNLNIVPFQTPPNLAEDGGILLNEDGGFALLESGDVWKPIGSTKEEAKIGILDYEPSYIEKIEFGSYPSPLILPESIKNEGSEFKIEDPTKDSLYTSFVLNDTIFKAGEYAKFNDTIGDSTYISRYNYSNYTKTEDIRIYKVKLYLQLTNGFIDLTEDVWKSYAQYRTGTFTDEFWFSDPKFKYYCRSNYKGKLVLSVELEDFSFILNYYNVDQADGVGGAIGNYIFNFNISLTETTGWTFSKLRINYSLDNANPTYKDYNITPPTNNSTDTYTLNIPISNEGKVMDFSITPIFHYPGISTDITSELPTKYLDKYTLTGSELLAKTFNYDTSGTELSGEYYEIDYY